MIKQFRKLVLASGSPRRKEYLDRYGFQFRQITADICEEPINGETPLEFVKRMALEKGEAVLEKCESDELIISADTIVTLSNEIFGKPKNAEQAIEFLTRLNGITHSVITAYSIQDVKGNIKITNHSQTEVTFKQCPLEMIERYANTSDPLDKAGAYSIQDLGAFMIKKISGSYNNVVGFPIEEIIEEMYKQHWIDFSF